MKKLISLVASFLICFSLMAGMTVCATDQLVTNSGFEDGLEGWEGDGILITTGENASPEGGNYVSLPETNKYVRQRITGLSAKTYEFSIWLKSTVDNAAFVRATPATYDGETYVNGSDKTFSFPNTTGTWKKVSTAVTLEEGQNALLLRFQAVSDDASLAWDGLTLKETNNLVQNGNFEVSTPSGKPSIWTIKMDVNTETDYVQRVMGGVHNSNSALEIKRTGTRLTATTSASGVLPETGYLLSFWCRQIGSGTGRTTGLSYEFRNDSNKIVDSTAKGSAYYTISNEWKKFTIYITTPVNTASIYLTLATGNKNTTVQYDEISIEKAYSSVEFYTTDTFSDYSTSATPTPAIGGVELDTLQAGTLKAFAHLSGADTSAALVIGVYTTAADNSKILTNVIIENGTKPGDDTNPYFNFSSDITIDTVSSGMILKAFLLSGTSNMQPYSAAKVLK
ncbi:MAG: hypothetical protein PUB07_08705 [Clostridia bacterium]|nr:hypothetical protein [Clostridia bacterium]